MELFEIVRILPKYVGDRWERAIFIIFCLLYLLYRYYLLISVSEIDRLLMNKTDKFKKNIFFCCITLGTLFLINYTIINNILLLAIVFLCFIVFGIVNFMLNEECDNFIVKWIRNFWGVKRVFVMVFITSIFSMIMRWTLKLDIIYYVTIPVIMEAFMLIADYEKDADIKAELQIEIENMKWYVYKKLDDGKILCGDKQSIREATKQKIVLLETLINQNICFEKIDSEV